MSGFIQNGATAAVGSGVINPAITGVTAGNALICVYVVNNAATLAAPTDSSGQTWTIAESFNAAGVAQLAIAYLLNANAGTHTLTWVTQPNGQESGISEWNGITGVGGTPVTNNASGVTTLTSASYTPGSASEAVIAFVWQSGTNTNDAIHCTTAGFQTIGSLSDSTPHNCIAVEQNGNLFGVMEANAQVISTSSALTCAWAWTPANPAAAILMGFTLTGSAPTNSATIAWIT
jgi:hypothetical protein